MIENNLEIHNLNIFSRNRKEQKSIVKNVSFSLKRGESLAIVGESGCGKTMTVMSMFQLLPGGCFATGEVLLGETNLIISPNVKNMRGKEIVLIPQSGMEFLDPVFKIKNQIFETLKTIGVPKENRYSRAVELLRTVGLENPEVVMELYPFEVSGGMAQRVILAIGMAANPDVIVADEPTRGIDSDGVDTFIDLLESAFSEKILIVVTHNIRVAEHCSKMLVMYDGEIMEYGPSKDILDYPRHPYSNNLLKDIPTDKRFLEADEIYDDRANQKDSCPFYLRCRYAKERCAKEHPALEETDGIQWRCFCA